MKANECDYFKDDPIGITRKIVEHGFEEAKMSLNKPIKNLTSQHYQHPVATFYHGPFHPDNIIHEKLSAHMQNRAQIKIRSLTKQSFPKTNNIIHNKSAKAIFTSDSKQSVKDFAKVVQANGGKAAYTPQQFWKWKQVKSTDAAPAPANTPPPAKIAIRNSFSALSNLVKKSKPKKIVPPISMPVPVSKAAEMSSSYSYESYDDDEKEDVLVSQIQAPPLKKSKLTIQASTLANSTTAPTEIVDVDDTHTDEEPRVFQPSKKKKKFVKQSKWDKRSAKNAKVLNAKVQEKAKTAKKAEYQFPNCFACNIAQPNCDPTTPDADLEHILCTCKMSIDIGTKICDPVIIRNMQDAQQKALAASNSKIIPPTIVPFWADKQFNDNVHPAMQFDIARGAIPQQFIEHNVRNLGLHHAQAEKLADLLSILMLERSHFIYKLHHKLHNNGRAEHAALNPPKHSLLGGPSLSGEGLEGLG